MNDILGILIPLLMSGADFGTILRALGGAGSGAVGMDGLQEMLKTQTLNARMAAPLVQNQKTIDSAADMLIDRMGVNPFSGFGQGLSALVGSMYHLAPDTIGAVLGVPNGGQFFSTIANGASGISQAAGFGTTDIFNPYSVLSAHERTLDMARTVYYLGVRPNGGYNISYGHGLNMDEMGKVTQRLLTSRIPYREYAEDPKTGRLIEDAQTGALTETGNTVDPTKEPEKFKKNLEKLGSKFNEAAAMLSKVTGSVEEALNVMDRLAGGNFLGGTAEQATKVANQARKMATNIRVTSAIAGINPQEMYANMQGLQQSMATGMGLNPYIAQASGFGNLLTNMAYNGTAAYTSWAAMNPDASPQQRQQALFVANGRAQAYANSNGAALAAAVADNAKLFTSDELERFKESYRAGRPNEMVGLIRERLGTNMYTEYMTDPAMQIAARQRATAENKDLLDAIDQAGEEGNLAQAENFGASRILKKTLSDLETRVTRVTGKSGFSKEIEDAGKESLRELARAQGLSDERVEQMSADDLRSFLKSRPNANAGEIERTENVAKIAAARARINELTLTSEDEKMARATLREEIGRSTNWSEEERTKLMRRIDSGDKLTDVYRDFAGGLKGAEAKELRTKVFGGKMTQEEAAREQTRLDRLEMAQRTDFTVNERLNAISNDVKKFNLQNVGLLKRQVVSLDSGVLSEKLSDKDSMERFAAQAKTLEGQGKVSLGGDDANLTRTFGEATREVVSGIFDNKLGSLEGDKLKTFKEDFSKRMYEKIRSGASIQEAFRTTVDWAKKEHGTDIGESGLKTLDKFVEESRDGNTKIGKSLSRESWLSAAASGIDAQTAAENKDSVRVMQDLLAGKFSGLSDKDAMERFASQAKTLEKSGIVSIGGNEKLTEMKVSGIEKILSERNLPLDETVRKKIAEQANRAVEEGGGKISYAEAISSAVVDYAKTDGLSKSDREKLNSGASAIGNDKDVAKNVMGNVLGQMRPRGQRVLGFEATSAAGNVNQAALVMAASLAKIAGLDMSQLNLGPEAEKLLSKMDSSASDAALNRIPNALAVGGASFRREAIRQTEANISALRESLTKGGVDAKTLQAAFGTGEDAKAAMTKVESALQKGGSRDLQYDKSMLKTLTEKKIGGESGISVLYDEAKFKTARGKAGADEDLAAITKETNRKDSDSYGILKAISDFTTKVAPFFSNPEQIFNVRIKESVPMKVAGQVKADVNAI